MRDTIGDSIQDWRDANDEHRLNGAESDDYYLKLPTPYRAHNANLESVTELLQIKGITPAIYNGNKERPGLADLVTVRGSGPVNMNTAAPHVLAGARACRARRSPRSVQGRHNSRPVPERPRKVRRPQPRASRRGRFASRRRGIVDDPVVARLIAIVQRRTDADPPSAICALGVVATTGDFYLAGGEGVTLR